MKKIFVFVLVAFLCFPSNVKAANNNPPVGQIWFYCDGNIAESSYNLTLNTKSGSLTGFTIPVTQPCVFRRAINVKNYSIFVSKNPYSGRMTIFYVRK